MSSKIAPKPTPKPSAPAAPAAPTVPDMIPMLMALAEKLQGMIDHLEPIMTAKAKKQPRAPKEPGGPKTGYMHMLHDIVSPILTAAAAEADESEKALYTQVKARSQIAKALWAKVKSGDITEDTVGKEEVLAEFAAWKVSPPETKYVSKKSDSESVSSAEKPAKAAKAKKDPKAAKAKKDPKAPKPKKLDSMTEEEKKAFYQERAVKAAAKRAANKVASEASEAAASASEEDAEVEADAVEEAEEAAGAVEELVDLDELADALEAQPEEEESEKVVAYKWEHNFGKGLAFYERIDMDGQSYIYNVANGKYLGVYVEATNKLNTKIPDPNA